MRAIGKIIIALALLLFLAPVRLVAQDGELLYSFSEAELRTLNANTMADVIRFIPSLSEYYEDERQKVDMGSQSFRITAVYRDGFPLFLDQNIEVDYQLIGLENVERVEFRASEPGSMTKNISGFNIYIFSKEVDIGSPGFAADLGNSSNNDFLSRASYYRSNKRHSLGLGLSRYFENGLKLNPGRRFDMAAFTLYNARAEYQFRFFDKAKLNASYHLSIKDQVGRSNIYPGTSRAEDHNAFTSYNWFGLGLEAKLSKSHQIRMQSQYTLNHYYRYIKEKDLKANRTLVIPVSRASDSVKYGFFFIRTVLEKKDSALKYGYSLGLEYSFLQDRVYKSIEAIKIGYTDYSLFAAMHYDPLSSLHLELGLNYLTNTLAGSMILPRALVKLHLSDELSIRLKHVQSAIYPQIFQQFYGSNYTNEGVENNLQLQAAQLQNSSFQLEIAAGFVHLKTGMIFNQIRNAVRLEPELNTWTNLRSSKDIMTFFGLDINAKKLKINSVLAIHGLNSHSDVENQFFFFPELSIKASYFIEQLHLGLFIFNKMMGYRDQLLLSLDGSQILSYQDYKLLNFGANKSFLDERLNIAMGFSNLLNHVDRSRTIYELTDLEQQELGSSVVYVGRGRSYFIRINLGF